MQLPWHVLCPLITDTLIAEEQEASQPSNQDIFMLVCFWLGATLHEQETAQSGQFAQTSNLLFPGPGKSKMVQTSNLLFLQPGKKQNGSDFEFAFSPTREKAKWFRLPICFFPTREKAKWFRLPICFFQAGKKQNGSIFAFSRAILLFPGPGKSKMVQTSNLLFPGPGKSKMYQTCSLESGLETSSASGT